MELRTWITLVPLLFPPVVLGHHSPNRYDFSEPVELSGEVIDFRWTNPHIGIFLAVEGSNGGSTEWYLEGNSVPGMAATGWTRSSLSAGDHVFARVFPNRNPGSHEAAISVIVRDDGTQLWDPRWFSVEKHEELARQLSTSRSGAGSTDFTGVWLPVVATLPDPPFGVYAKLTGPGEAARASPDPADDPMAKCLAPTFPMITSAPGYLLRIQRVEDNLEFAYEFMDGRRVIHLETREHPPASEIWRNGHSVGTIENGVLQVDTRNFSFEPWGTARGVPSSDQKTVVERYSLADNGTRLRLEYTVEDPVYLAEPERGIREWEFQPNRQFEDWNCDLESASRHLNN